MESLTYRKCKNEYTIMALMIVSIFFIFNPLLSIIFFFLFVVKHNYVNSQTILLACILCSVYISLVNANKVAENDLVWYIEKYVDAQNYSYWEYIAGKGLLGGGSQEQGYTTLVWVINRFFDGNIWCFKFFVSLINYMFLTSSFLIYYKRYKCESPIPIFAAVFIMCFTPYIFTMSLQLVRQFLAGSVFTWLLVKKCVQGKTNIFLLICLPLLHTTALLFIPFFLFPQLDKPIRKEKLFYICLLIALLGIQIISQVLSKISFLSDIAAINYALSRASTGTSFDLGPLPLSKIVFILAILFVCIKIKRHPAISEEPGIKRFSNTLIFLCIFILINFDQSELSNRLCFYLFPFIPYVFLWGLRIYKRFASKELITGFTLFMIVFWSLYLHIGTWTYLLPVNVWLLPLWLYM